ncbi:MAG TPA: AMP-binding protein [Candidatus Acidoferrales bacterium]|nr:AMP-binding protein [Candidatus Acidoferrales bacterium]
MNFLEVIWMRLEDWANRQVLEEIHANGRAGVTGAELLAWIQAARVFLRQRGLQPGDRCGLLAANSIRWVAMDLAIMAEGAVVVPLYARQAPAELGVMLQDSAPRLVVCGDGALRATVAPHSGGAPTALFEEAFGGIGAIAEKPRALHPEQPVTIIYTSGTSGTPKGVPLTVANVGHMLPCTSARLDRLMGQRNEPERVFHYLPCCFAASWIVLLTCLGRDAVLSFSTDLQRVAEELAAVAPNYFLNVPVMLERMRARIRTQIAGRRGLAAAIFEAGEGAWYRKQARKPKTLDGFRLRLARATVFAAIRKRLGPQLEALICGSAPLAVETQLFFFMLGIRVLQGYGLTETTGICTLDDPEDVVAGRVGPAIPGIEMKLGPHGEILVRGPNVFPGYWRRPEETALVLRDGWLHTGDQGEANERGIWRITGRVKNLIILSSGHNVPPEPLEEMLVRSIPGAEQAMVVGNDRSFLVAVITGAVKEEDVRSAFEDINARLPHFERLRAFHLHPEPFTIESGLLTANGKLRREAVQAALRREIEQLYASPQPQAARD